jgi:aspartyl protease family protein
MKKAVIPFLFLPVFCHAGVFKCKTESGRITYSEEPCAVGAMRYEARQASIGESSQYASFVRGSDGVFKAAGTVNNQPVEFVIDTGASVTTLGGDIASRLGLRDCVNMGIAHTANGQTPICRVTLAKLTIAGFTFSNVPVAVSPNMRGVGLLGNDLLKQFNVNLQGNMLTLTR